MTTSTPLTKESIDECTNSLHDQRGKCDAFGICRPSVETLKVWLAVQWLKKQIAEEAQLSSEKIVWVNGYVEQAFGACRPDKVLSDMTRGMV